MRLEAGFLALAAALVLASATFAAPDDARGRAVGVRFATSNRLPEERLDAKLELITTTGGTLSRELTLLKRSGAKPSEDRIVTRFRAPREVAGLGVLTVQQPGEDGQWLYLPSTKGAPKRIAAAERDGYFAGTDFTYEDLRSEDPETHDYAWLREEPAGGEACDVIEARARGAEAEVTGYERRVLWVAKATALALRIECYGRNGKLAKTIAQSDVREVAPGVHRGMRVEVDNPSRGGHRTVLAIVKVDAAPKLEDRTFTPWFLEHGAK